MSYDYLVVGAGFAGSVMAEQLASVSGKTVLLCDKRPHIGGNAYDVLDASGILIHPYGPHIFHTNSKLVFDYLSRFTEWTEYEHRVKASVDGKLLTIPINLDTVNRLYGWSMTSEELAMYFAKVSELHPGTNTAESEIVSRIGRDLYEKFFRNYLRKQWGLEPSELDPCSISHTPVRTTHDSRYFDHTYQAMPKDGYTKMFERIVSHPNITVALEADYKDLLAHFQVSSIVYTGPIDAFFEYHLGKLPYRSLEFRFETHAVDRYLSAAEIKYPNENEFTRAVEFKWFTGQKNETGKTTVVYEYPRAQGEAYFPIPRAENTRIYGKYQKLAEGQSNVHFLGRLAHYRYLSMDQVVAQALATASKLAGRGERQELSDYLV